MTDIFFPADLIPTGMMFGVDDFTAVDESATVGAMQSSTLYGTRRWRLRMDFAVLAGTQLARFEGLVAALRGRQNRVWISPGRAPRGSFPDVELLANNTFANGATGWANFNPTLGGVSATDRVLRSSRINAGQSIGPVQSITPVINLPYAARTIVSPGRGPSNFHIQASAASGNLADQALSGNYAIIPWTPTVITSAQFIVYENSITGGQAGDYFETPWTSFARCALVDNAPNLLQQSDTFDNAYWSQVSTTVVANSGTAPDGTSTADGIQETAVTSTHEIKAISHITVPAAALDYCLSVAVKAGTRGWIQVLLSEDTGATTMGAYFDLSSGATGSVFTGANWANTRTFSQALGNGWFRCTVIGLKTNAATVLTVRILVATSNGGNSYLGVVGSDAIKLWRASVAQSSFPVFATQTASAAFAGNTQTGNQVYLKGLPVSTTGLLLQGDLVEIDMPTNSQLVRVTARLDSDSQGTGVLQFEHTLKQSPADGAAVAIQQPMGRWVLANSTLGVEYVPGLFGQASLEFVEASP